MTTCNTWGLEEVPTKRTEVKSLQIYIYIYIYIYTCLEMTCVNEADGRAIRRLIFCSIRKLPPFLSLIE